MNDTMNKAERSASILSKYRRWIWRIAITFGVLALCLAAGLVARWLALSTPRINTETPSDEHVTLCREIFRLHPDLEIEPLGYRRLDSLDISHGFKFIAKTEDPSELLDERLSAMVKFREDFDSSFLDRVVRSSWWKRAQEGGLGTGFESSLNGFFWHTGIYCHRNGDGTLTVWAYAESGANYNEQELKEVGPQEFRGHYYQLFVEEDWLSWDEASARCEATGGYLVVVNDQEENGFLAGLVAGKAPYFLGARSAEGTGAWKWIDGSPMTYQNWLEGQPIADRKAASCLRAQPFVWPAWCESPGSGHGIHLRVGFRAGSLTVMTSWLLWRHSRDT